MLVAPPVFSANMRSVSRIIRQPECLQVESGADPEILERGGPPMVNYGKEGDQYVKYI